MNLSDRLSMIANYVKPSKLKLVLFSKLKQSVSKSSDATWVINFDSMKLFDR